MSSLFVVTVTDQGLRRALENMADRARDLQPVLQSAGEALVERTKRRFETSTDPDGKPWQPLSAVTDRLWEAKRLGGPKNLKKDGSLRAHAERSKANRRILVDEGNLRRQIVAMASKDTLVVRATTQYAAIHQFGGQAGRGRKTNIPARPFLPIQSGGAMHPDELSLFIRAVRDYLSEAEK
jgi:phage virion morphogenesis protein